MEQPRGPLQAALPSWRSDLAGALLGPQEALPVPPAGPSGHPTRASWDAIAAQAAPRVARLIGTARAELAVAWPSLTASLLARIHRDRDREAYETVVFDRQDRLTRAALAAALTGETAFLDAVADGVLLLAEQSTWCWPAHDDARERAGWVLPDSEHPYLDLGAGEVAAQLAWVDAILGSWLDERWPGLRERVRREVDLRVFVPFLERRDWQWIGIEAEPNNWNPWIHGNVIVAALRLMEESDPRRLAIIEQCLIDTDRYVAVLPADGAIDEGYGYWWNGAARLIEELDLVRYATGGALDAAALPVLTATLSFPRHCHLGGDWFLNVADGQARADQPTPWWVLFRGAQWLGDAASASYAVQRRDASGPAAALGVERHGLGRYLRALSDPQWLTAKAEPDSAAGRTATWWPSVQILTTPPPPGHVLGLTVKGGHNGEQHNHLDVGEVVVDVAGVPVLVDIGRPTYTAGLFGPDRYDEWCLTSPWHNVPTIAGVTQGVGQEFRARDVAVTLPARSPVDPDAADEEWSGVTMGLVGAYPGVSGQWRRSARVEHDGDVRIEDAWTIAEPDGPIEIHYVIAGQVTWPEADGTAPADGLDVAPLDGAPRVRLSWHGAQPIEARIERRELVDPLHSGVWGDHLTRLTLVGKARTGSVTVTVTTPGETRVTPTTPAAPQRQTSGMMPAGAGTAALPRNPSEPTSNPQERP